LGEKKPVKKETHSQNRGETPQKEIGYAERSRACENGAILRRENTEVRPQISRGDLGGGFLEHGKATRVGKVESS